MRRTAAGTSPLHLAAAAHSLTLALGRIQGVRSICHCVLRHVLRAMPCRHASFAVPTADGDLAIVATLGYPHALVEHLRIEAGKGPIGTVYETGRPLVVADVSTVAGMQRRLRYKTDSFVAMPLVADRDVLGVICVSDRLDERPFTRHHAAMLRRLAAPAALALALEESRRQARASAHAAMLDPLSGLYNRRYFQVRLEEEMQRAQRDGTMLGLVMLDIDDFKCINDRFGHTGGDVVIRDVSEILRRSVRRFDVCVRFGGDEFAVVMANTDEQRTRRVAERIRKHIAGYRSADPRLAGLELTASIGISVTGGRNQPQVLVERVDQAMYAAKQSGKNRVLASFLTRFCPAPEILVQASQIAVG